MKEYRAPTRIPFQIRGATTSLKVLTWCAHGFGASSIDLWTSRRERRFPAPCKEDGEPQHNGDYDHMPIRAVFIRGKGSGRPHVGDPDTRAGEGQNQGVRESSISFREASSGP